MSTQTESENSKFVEKQTISVPKVKKPNGIKQIFLCDLKNCNRKFAAKFSLQRHYASHYVDKHLQCSQCPSRFSLQQYLEDHERTHTGLRPYECQLCLMTFKQRGKLSVHKSKVHSSVAAAVPTATSIATAPTSPTRIKI